MTTHSPKLLRLRKLEGSIIPLTHRLHRLKERKRRAEFRYTAARILGDRRKARINERAIVKLCKAIGKIERSLEPLDQRYDAIQATLQGKPVLAKQ